MVDITYLGFDGEPSKKLTDLPLKQRRALLQAPFLPFDGMNEKGLAIGMAAVPPGDMTPDPQKETIDQLVVIREILDHAATVDEAIRILGSYNIEMGEVPIHYLIASASGNSALVEFHQGQMVVTRNELPWQQATNFLVAATHDSPTGACWRYDLIGERLNKNGGQITTVEGLNLLADVSQPSTQWSILYDMTSGEVQVVMGRNYTGKIHTFKVNR
jgi:predicted choloylglycine hydrolase